MSFRIPTFAAATLTVLLASVSPALAVAAVPPSALTSPSPLVCIDPGHGRPFSNANANGLHERTVDMQIAFLLRDTLLARGYRVMLTHATDAAVETRDTQTWNLGRSGLWSYAMDRKLYYQERIPKDDLTARTRIANRAGADLFISIHCNGAKRRSAHGTEVWVSPKDSLGAQLAKLVEPAVARRSGFKNRGVFTNDFYVLRWTNMPAILVESAFITNRSDAAKLKRAGVRRNVAIGIAEGVDAWFATRPVRKRMARVSASSQEAEAVALSHASFPTGAATVIVVRSDRAADAPGAAGLAVKLGGSLLESAKSVPSTATLEEIVRLRPTRVLLVGVTGSLDLTATANALETLAASAPPLLAVVAADRVELSAIIALRMGTPGGGCVAIVNARDTAAALALVPVAARTGMPILLTRDATAAPAAAYLATKSWCVKRVLRVSSRYSPASVATTASVQTMRYADPARIAYALASPLFSPTSSALLQPLVASQARPGDVLSASVRGARMRQPVLAISGSVISPYVRLFITNRRPAIASFTLLDSDGCLPPLVDTELAKCDARASASRKIAAEPLEGARQRIKR